MSAFEPVDTVPVLDERARVYAEGWQSWSPRTAYPAPVPPLLPEEPWQHTMRYRPGTELDELAHQAEGLAVIDPGDGGPVHVYLTADLADPVAASSQQAPRK